MTYEEKFKKLTKGIWNLTWLLEGEGAMTSPQAKFPPYIKLKEPYIFGHFLCFFTLLQEIPKFTLLQGRLIILQVQETCITLFFWQISEITDCTTTFKHIFKCFNLSKLEAKNYRQIAETKNRRSSMPNFAPARHVEMVKAGHIPNASVD